MTGASQVLEHPKHRVGDAVDIREEGLCDDRNAHTKMVSRTTVAKVATENTTRKVLVLLNGCRGVAELVPCAPEKGG